MMIFAPPPYFYGMFVGLCQFKFKHKLDAALPFFAFL
jgi:hypothetical protein